MKRISVMQLHVLPAGFLLPLACLFFVSGLLYTLDIKGSVDKQKIELPLAQPFKPDLETLMQLTSRALLQRQLPVPDGEPSIKKNKKGVFVFRWNSLARSATIKAKRNDQNLTLVYRQRSLLTRVMRIHRAEAGVLFQAFSTLLAVGLMAVLFSGVYLALGIPRLRLPLLISVTMGTTLFCLFLLV